MNADPSIARLRFDRFELDEADARLLCAGEAVALAPKPFAVLCALARARSKAAGMIRSPCLSKPRASSSRPARNH